MVSVTPPAAEFTIISQITLDTSKKLLAFGTDRGIVGVVDLALRCITRMKSQHNSVRLSMCCVVIVVHLYAFTMEDLWNSCFHS